MSPKTGRTVLLAPTIRACLFDLDGVLTDTATMHATAWKEMFDGFLRTHAQGQGGEIRPFDQVEDYDEYVDGKERLDGVRSFLASRAIELPEGTPADPPSAETVGGLGNRKNELVLTIIHRDGVRAFAGSVRFVEAVRAAGLRCAVVSASANCREVLEGVGLAPLFDTRVDAVVAEDEHLRGKPAPDMFLAAAKRLGVRPAEAAVFEDALAGMDAARAGRFGFIVGVDRVGQSAALLAHGADTVVSDLAELLGPE
jgi:beta-phosphoglucomutase family hydrolase